MLWSIPEANAAEIDGHDASAARRVAEARERAEPPRSEASWRPSAPSADPPSYLPAAGEPGPAALRTPGRLRLPRHQDTVRHARRGLPVPRRRRPRLGKASSSARTSTRARRSSTTRGCSTARPDHRTEPRARRHRRLRQVIARQEPLHPLDPVRPPRLRPRRPEGRAHRRRRSRRRAARSSSATACANRLNPLDEGHRPSATSDAEWASQVASRRRDLIGALAETVLERRSARWSTPRSTSPSTDTVRSCRGTRSCRWSSTDSSPPTRPTTPTAGSPRTAGSSATHCVASSPATSPGCSTDPRTVTLRPDACR